MNATASRISKNLARACFASSIWRLSINSRFHAPMRGSRKRRRESFHDPLNRLAIRATQTILISTKDAGKAKGDVALLIAIGTGMVIDAIQDLGRM